MTLRHDFLYIEQGFEDGFEKRQISQKNCRGSGVGGLRQCCRSALCAQRQIRRRDDLARNCSEDAIDEALRRDGEDGGAGAAG
jgi:hypothetical protein